METTVRPGSLRGWTDLVIELGGKPASLLESVGLPPDALSDEDVMIPARAGMHLLEVASSLLGCPDFALRLSLYQDLDAFGPLSPALQNAATVRDTLKLASQWLFIHSPALALSVEESDGHAAVIFDVTLYPLPNTRQTVDLTLATCHHLFATVLGSAYRPVSVWLTHSPLAPLTKYVHFFSATVHPESTRAKLVVPTWFLDVRLPNADADIRANALAFIQSKYLQPEATLADRVQYFIFQTLGTPDADHDAVARALSMHPRTMQRHLRSEGTSFTQIKEEVLRNTARRYLVESTMSFSALAQILGFSELSAFTRASTKWFGASPTIIRATRW